MIQDPSLIVVEDVDGAPVRMGESVKVVSVSADDSSMDRHFLGRTGVVVALVFDEPRLQFPHDPLIQVRVDGLGEDLFFPEELELAPEWARRRLSELRQSTRV
ncbi:Carotenogenesis protein CarS [Vitiosangium sp. GDMCC 1.1324]|uniref:Carotenogenesis protein CarS n=1 Tax=Vitiosangium sp. (strain GDMCC 1.1324) TaxID=2138576 RepID=UPI000D391513|nr:Carotenogenesis protein CarS [Vitiosangium sp. GDMCC 1.1324]PTL85284.1 Carotenogenesis protein CarS [Vitiosangium sp. GDMCC 1.1324]